MRQKPGFTAVLLALTLVVLQAFGPFLSAQTAPPSGEELDQLLAPVALYPDSLLSQITTASTNPQEILDVDNWLSQNPGLTGTALTDAAQQQGFDPAFIALANFPQILEMMAQHIDDYAAIGAAFSADQGAVSNSIQRLRDQAYNAGTLKSTSQQQVEVQRSSGQPIYVIQPANPQVVYVPVYDPTVVYVRPAVYSTPLITFGLGIGIGALLIGNQPWGWGGWGWNWGSRRAYYNHGYWGGWSNPYRPPRPWYRPRPIIWSNRPGYRGNWGYRPQGYRPPRPGGGPGYSRPPYGPGNRPGYRPPGNRPGQPSIQPVRPGMPNRPGTGRPDQNRPPQPGIPRPMPNRPTPQPTRPGYPDRPGTDRPGSDRPGTGRPGTGRPSTDRPGADRPGNGRPGTNPPGQGRPTAPGQTPPNGPSIQPARPGGSDRPAARPAPEARPAPQVRPQPETPKADPNQQRQPRS